MGKVTRQWLAVLCLALPVAAACAGITTESGPPWVSGIDYRFVGHLEQSDDAGRRLVWEARVDGALTGDMKWWFVTPPPVQEVAYEGGRTSFYAARWELWSDGRLILAGESAGKTVFPDGQDGIWDGHGVVTDAADEHRSLLGRKIYETGPVAIGAEPPVSLSGSGMFVIY